MRSRFGSRLVSVHLSISATVVRHVSSQGRNPSDGGDRVAKMSFGIDPSKLNLDLNFDKMDFTQVAASTREAMSQERHGTKMMRDDARSMEAAAQEGAVKPPSSPEASALPEQQHGLPTGGRTVRGIVGAGDAHDNNSPSAAYAQQRREGNPGGRGRGGGRGFGSSDAGRGQVRYTLMDAMRDCSMSGNWLKAYKTFEGAVDKSCGMILSSAGSAEAGGPSHSDGSGAPAESMRGTQREAEVFAQLSKLMAALPPRNETGMDRASNVARDRNMRNMAGIVRWNGGHFNLLLRTLLAAERIEEVERVWTVMKAVGFVRYQMEERTFNAIVGMVRRSTQAEDATQQMVAPVVSVHRVGPQLERERALKRQIIIELEEAARARGMRLRGANERTASIARIAEAMHVHESGEPAGAPLADSPQLRIGDFNGLLRVAQSHEGTLRVLAMMEKLAIPKDAATLASVITAHRSPTYRVDGATDAEIAAARGDQATDTDEHDGDDADGDGAAVHTADTKEAYESYKNKRIASAKQWFKQCPAEDRTAGLYTEMLYLLRAATHNADFDSLLTELRGNAVRDVEQWAAVDAASRATAERTRARLGSAAAGEPPAQPAADANNPRISVILPAAWTAEPNGRTYELLIRRARYRHDWEGFWELYREMQLAGSRGTPKLYQLIMKEAKAHPPASVKKHGDVAALIMELYSDMRRNNVDVTSVDSTLNLVNAWSATRGKRRWT